MVSIVKCLENRVGSIEVLGKKDDNQKNAYCNRGKNNSEICCFNALPLIGLTPSCNHANKAEQKCHAQRRSKKRNGRTGYATQPVRNRKHTVACSAQKRRNRHKSYWIQPKGQKRNNARQIQKSKADAEARCIFKPHWQLTFQAFEHKSAVWLR